MDLRGGRTVEGVADLQPLGQGEFLPQERFPRALGHGALHSQLPGGDFQSLHPSQARQGLHGLLGHGPAKQAHNRLHGQPAAGNAGLHMLHPGLHPAAAAGRNPRHIHDMGEIRRSLQGVDLPRIPLGVQGVEDHPAADGDLVLQRFRRLRHGHAAGVEYPRFLPQSPGKGHFPLHHRLAPALGGQAFHLYAFLEQSHIHGVSPFRLPKAMRLPAVIEPLSTREHVWYHMSIHFRRGPAPCHSA